MKYCVLGILLSFSIFVEAQDTNQYEKSPVFEACEGGSNKTIQKCFYNQVHALLFNEFTLSENLEKENYKGHVDVLFEVTTRGEFKVIYVDAEYDELKTETYRVFKTFPKVKPATYSGKKTYKQYSIKINVPVTEKNISVDEAVESGNQEKEKIKQINIELSELEKNAKKEFDELKKGIKPYTNKAFKSTLNIPFTHDNYAKFDRSINLVGTNSHTASKPFIYEDVSNYYDFIAAKVATEKETASWLERKLWNEHLVQLQSKDYWFTLDPILDVQIGRDTDADFRLTYNNTRGVFIQGGLGEQLSFSTSIYESQGRFADYYNRYSESLAPADFSPAIIPGRGIAKRFKENAYDYPVAEAYLSYSPAKFINVQFGHGKNFIGDGYRSLLLSDVASPSPFLKLNTKFWKIKYTNTWMWLKDVRPEVIEDGAFLTKYIANHYLSWNVNKRLNIGLFESVVWQNSNDRGFDVNYLNPIIFYRAIEFETGQDAGNAILGLSSKYKYNDNANIYGQFIVDEFSLSDISGGKKSWKNKLGFQLGAKYFNAFKIKDLQLQLEYNQVRPYTYSHNTIVLNYAHNNQSLAHLWGANFKELLLIGRYNYKRWFGEAKFIVGIRGLDFNTGTDSFSYGGNVFSNEKDRPFDEGVKIGQGIKTKTFNATLQGGYLINSASNLKLFATINYRDFNPEAATVSTFKNGSVWFNFGVRTDLFNWYFDF